LSVELTGEDWAEKIACEICQVLGIPHVHYDLAVELQTGIVGTVCRNIARRQGNRDNNSLNLGLESIPSENAAELILGNVLLSKAIESYLENPANKFKASQHTVAAVAESLSSLKSPLDRYCEDLPVGVESAIEVFIGYVMLDALVANQDRHHENWGALKQEGQLSLAPTFDHGAALGRNERDSKRSRILDGQDSRLTIDSYAVKARSAFYGEQSSVKPLGTLEAFLRFAQLSPKAAKAWQGRLEGLTPEVLESIVDRIPAGRMSGVARRFTIELVKFNRSRIMGLRF
jgi:hypothetical protein